MKTRRGLDTYLHRLTKELGLSQREICQRAGLSASALSDIMRGKYNPSPYTIDRLISVFGEQHRTPLMQLAGHLPADVEPRHIEEEQILYRIEQEIRRLRTRMPVLRDVAVAAGEPFDVEGEIELADVVDAKDPLAVIVGGICLNEAGIGEGDILIIDRGRLPEVGEIALLSTELGPALKFWPDKPNEILEAQCIGVAVKVLKDVPRRG